MRTLCVFLLALCSSCVVSGQSAHKKLAEKAGSLSGQMTVGDLYRFCTASNDADKTACTFYILGVFEGAQIAGSTKRDRTGNFQEAKEKQFCVPEGLASSAMEIIIKIKMGEDLALFPQDRNLPAVSFITAVIARDYPCEKTR